jgi:UDP-2-acetamido-3-amino-2,3-dideoxy-glucuronate N-acetyltransferase
MKKNIVVVGCGHWGKNLVRNFAEIGSLYAVCDPNLDLSSELSEKYKVHNLSFEQILEDSNIQGVVLAIPAPLHASFAIKVMNSGKHAYVEKPLAMNENEAIAMIQSSKENNVHLMVGHLLQYHPIYIKVKEMVKSKVLGDIHYIYSNRSSFGKIRTQEDVIWSFAPHDISMILALSEEKIDSVRAESKCIVQKDIADLAIINLTFSQGLKAHINVSWLNPYKEHRLVVIGSDGSLVFDDTKNWKEKLAFFENEFKNLDNEIYITQNNKSYIDVIESEPLRNECKHFMEVVNNDSHPLTNGYEGLKVLKVLSAASKSKITEEVIKIDS